MGSCFDPDYEESASLLNENKSILEEEMHMNPGAV